MLTNQPPPTIHLMLRIRPSVRIGRQQLGTVAEHNSVVEQKGLVAIGKFGQKVTSSTINRLSEQICNGIDTKLILVEMSNGTLFGYFSRLEATYGQDLPSELNTYTPPYYLSLTDKPSTWFVVDRPFVRINLEDFQLSTSKRILLDVVRECRTTAMVVEEVTAASEREIPK